MQVKVKKTGVVWEIDEASPTGKRVKANPADYEILDERATKRRKDME